MLTFATFWTPWIETATAWLLTYFLHSSLLLASAFLLVRALPERLLPARELVWRTALVGGLLTATLQVGLAVSPLAGAWDLDIANRAATESAIVQSEPHASVPPVATSGSRSVRSTSGRSISATEASAAATRPWLTLIVTGWVGIATLLMTLLAVSYLRLVQRLGSRRSLRRGTLVEILDRLVERAGARSTDLAQSDRITVPLARGIRRHEICLPARMENEMSAERQEIVLAHELAHLQRHDPAWLLGMRLLESVMFFQPLNRLARRELQEIAEFRCDDWAVATTGRPVTMARCLTDVAGWSLERRLPTLVPTMAVDGSRLGRRVSRLLARDYPSPPVAAPRWLSVATLLILALFVAVAPGVSRPAASDEDERQIVVLSDEVEIHREVERVLVEMDSDFEIEMEQLQADLQVRLDEISVELEPLEKELEVLVAQVEAQFADLDPTEWPTEGFEPPDPEAMARIEEITSRISEAYQPTEEDLRRLTEATAEFQERVMVEVERALESAREEHEMAREEIEIAREAVEMSREEIEMAREAAEMSRQEFETAREEHEMARQEIEEARATARDRASAPEGSEETDGAD